MRVALTNAKARSAGASARERALIDALATRYSPDPNADPAALAGAYAEGKGVPKSLFEAYKWCAIADRWNVPSANLALEQAARELPADEAEKAKAAALAYTFKTK